MLINIMQNFIRINLNCFQFKGDTRDLYTDIFSIYRSPVMRTKVLTLKNTKNFFILIGYNKFVVMETR